MGHLREIVVGKRELEVDREHPVDQAARVRGVVNGAEQRERLCPIDRCEELGVEDVSPGRAAPVGCRTRSARASANAPARRNGAPCGSTGVGGSRVSRGGLARSGNFAPRQATARTSRADAAWRSARSRRTARHRRRPRACGRRPPTSRASRSNRWGRRTRYRTAGRTPPRCAEWRRGHRPASRSTRGARCRSGARRCVRTPSRRIRRLRTRSRRSLRDFPEAWRGCRLRWSCRCLH